MTSGTQNGAGGNGDKRRRRPLLEPAFVTELQRLSENARRISLSVVGRRRSTPTSETSRRPTRAAKPVEGREQGARRRKADRPARAGRSASLARLFHRLFRGRHESLYLLIDGSESMEMRSAESGQRKWDQARRLVAALAVASRSRYERVFIGALGQAGGRRAPLLTGETEESQRIFESLERLKPGGKGRFLTAIASLVRRAPADAACVVFSDFMSPEWEEAVALLAESRIRQVTLVQILDPQDLAGASSSALILRDADTESSRPLALDPGIAAGLRETLERFCGDLAANCREIGIGYAMTHTDEPFETPLLEALTDRTPPH